MVEWWRLLRWYAWMCSSIPGEMIFYFHYSFFIRVFEAALFADHWELCVVSSDISFLFSIFVFRFLFIIFCCWSSNFLIISFFYAARLFALLLVSRMINFGAKIMISSLRSQINRVFHCKVINLNYSSLQVFGTFYQTDEYVVLELQTLQRSRRQCIGHEYIAYGLELMQMN